MQAISSKEESLLKDIRSKLVKEISIIQRRIYTKKNSAVLLTKLLSKCSTIKQHKSFKITIENLLINERALSIMIEFKYSKNQITTKFGMQVLSFF